MPTRKQRKRLQKGRRHEGEKVWIHPDGTASAEPPEDFVEPSPREKRADGKKPQQKGTQQRSSTRTPLPPSWRRAARRSVLLGAVIFVLFALLNSNKGSNGYLSALLLAVLYTLLFIPFTYYV